jgi:hypothetical protein
MPFSMGCLIASKTSTFRLASMKVAAVTTHTFVCYQEGDISCLLKNSLNNKIHLVALGLPNFHFHKYKTIIEGIGAKEFHTLIFAVRG